MNEQRKQILEMLSTGKINVSEAEKLLQALSKEPATSLRSPSDIVKPAPKYLRVVVESGDNQNSPSPSKVNVRIPMQLLRAGVKLAGLLPTQAKEQMNAAFKENGMEFDVNTLKVENLDSLIDQLNELTVDVEDAKSKVRIFCE